MLRYLINPEKLNSKYEYYDAIVVGAGLAGMYACLNLPQDWRIAILTKEDLSVCNSDLAQGGIAATMDADDFEGHVQDTLRAGAYANDEGMVRLIVTEGREHIHQLIKWGVRFDRDEAGALSPTREGGHNARRVLHYQDATGHEVMTVLGNLIKKRQNIDIIEGTVLVDILTNPISNSVLGVSIIDAKNEFHRLDSSNVVIATGGIGQLYTHTTNSTISSGDGIAAAVRAGAVVKDMEMIQFHPSAFYESHVSRHFLISEAVRGEGGILRNSRKEPFMANVHPLKDLAPRDIVAREIYKQIKQTNDQFVYLDVTHLDHQYIVQRFPMIYQTCLNKGIDMKTDLIPVCPVEHYHMGGVQTDEWGKTNVEGLYAVGEVACTGAHGANRLASNSLLEALVFGARTAKYMSSQKGTTQNAMSTDNFELKQGTVLNIDLNQQNENLLETIRNILTQYGFIFRTKAGINEGLRKIERLMHLYGQAEAYDKSSVSALNALVCAFEILKAASVRQTSLGAHQLIEE